MISKRKFVLSKIPFSVTNETSQKLICVVISCSVQWWSFKTQNVMRITISISASMRPSSRSGVPPRTSSGGMGPRGRCARHQRRSSTCFKKKRSSTTASPATWGWSHWACCRLMVYGVRYLQRVPPMCSITIAQILLCFGSIFWQSKQRANTTLLVLTITMHKILEKIWKYQ